MLSDTELMLKFQEGDEKAFDLLIEKYYKLVFNYFCHMSWDKTMAEDICQEVFVKLYKSGDKYKPVTTFKAYLFTIARNVFIDNYRKQKKRKTLSLDVEYGSNKFSDMIEARGPNPSEVIDSNERLNKIMAAVYRLPEILKDVFLLSEIENLKYAEISEILDIPVGTVKSRMFNAVKKLRELLKGLQTNEVR
ncbi:MAG: hypothetical protein COA79_11100 [Planctomycetota bacterium]|nr:MAG: hypothetical protein COA79_11100 [Planctomycetota bacterium]